MNRQPNAWEGDVGDPIPKIKRPDWSSMNVSNGDDASTRSPRWPWGLLALAMVWVALVRIPLLLNAETHLDSDLAVDGLTLLEAVQGHWRWHYPGTPHMGIAPVLLSWPQANVWGANPFTLVSGGILAYELLVLTTFLLGWSVFGPAVAAWSLVPLAFASTGTVWLSGRITGGHLLSAVWHAGAFLLLYETLARGGLVRSAILGLWCGLGFFLDQMFLFTLLTLIPGLVMGGFGPGRLIGKFAACGLFVIGFAVGDAPRELGVRLDPYDAYNTQFQTIFVDARTGLWDGSQTRALLAEHSQLLLADCLPRLIGGYRWLFVTKPKGALEFRGFRSEPSPESLRGRAPLREEGEFGPVSTSLSGLSLALFVVAMLALAIARPRTCGNSLAVEAVRWGLLLSSLVVIVGFLVNRNIYNSDNYRYLVFLLVPWPIGFGLFLEWQARRGGGGLAVAVLLATALALLTTLDTARWYQRFGWVDGLLRPVRQPLDDPSLEWLRAHPEVTQIFGGYWDVYRLSFLTGGRVEGVPYPDYPDRFPEWSRDLPGHRPRVLIARADARGPFYRQLALQQGGRILAESPGLWIIDWP